MKGVVYSEFLEMLEGSFDPVFVENLIEEADLPSVGMYTSVGTYDWREMVQLVSLLSEKSGTPVADLIKSFGGYLLHVFVRSHGQMFTRDDNTYTVLERLNDRIHVDVKKLYPDAELPTFAHRWLAEGQLELTYRSPRPFADLAEGLIRECIKYVGEDIAVTRRDISVEPEAHTVFVLTQQ
jgi:hypothetical protein